MTDLPQWVDGPRFVAWIERVRPDYMAELTDTHHRALYRFRQPGAKGSVETVDRICVALFLHLHEIPEDVWTWEPPSKGKQVDQATKKDAVEMVKSGTPVAEAARRFGVHYETLRYWLYGKANG